MNSLQEDDTTLGPYPAAALLAGLTHRRLHSNLKAAAPAQNSHWRCIQTDSRKPLAGGMFVALRGPNFDGHRFVASAIAQGAAAVLVDDPKALEGCEETLAKGSVYVACVDDTLLGLAQLAHAWRKHHGGKMVAISGSGGKTTTKELLAAALQPLGPVHKTCANLNNRIGVPRTLFDWRKKTHLAVVEMGMSLPGEMAALVEMGAPDVAVLTNVGPVHLEGVGGILGVAREKGALFAGLAPDGVAMVCLDDAHIVEHCAPRHAGRKVTFGYHAKAQVRILAESATPGGRCIELEVASDVGPMGAWRGAFTVPLMGAHNAQNVAAAVGVGFVLGADPQAMQASLAEVVVPGGRMRRKVDGVHKPSVIDDTYNANPMSVRAAVAALAEEPCAGRRILVLGEMGELGPDAAHYHRQMGDVAAEYGLAAVFALGDHAQEVVDAAAKHGLVGQAFAADGLDGLVAALQAYVQPEDWMLVKGSRFMAMERVVAAIDDFGNDDVALKSAMGAV